MFWSMRMVTTYMKQKCTNIFKESTPCNLSLGRWKVKKHQEHSEVINNFWNNSDHCGDVICGDPIKNKHLLEQKLQQIYGSDKKHPTTIK